MMPKEIVDGFLALQVVQDNAHMVHVTKIHWSKCHDLASESQLRHSSGKSAPA